MSLLIGVNFLSCIKMHFRLHFLWVPFWCTFGYFSVLCEASTQRKSDIREVASWIRKTLCPAVSCCTSHRLWRLWTRAHLRFHPVLSGCFRLTGATKTDHVTKEYRVQHIIILVYVFQGYFRGVFFPLLIFSFKIDFLFLIKRGQAIRCLFHNLTS